jgi:prepilin-type N-terminal cleavage/methylation domain-containing protein
MRHGLSMVELSIVLFIFGLLTGSILDGQSLIKAAEPRSLRTDISLYQSALFAFRDKYMALPGDMTNATSFWGTAVGTEAFETVTE